MAWEVGNPLLAAPSPIRRRTRNYKPTRPTVRPTNKTNIQNLSKIQEVSLPIYDVYIYLITHVLSFNSVVSVALRLVLIRFIPKKRKKDPLLKIVFQD